MRNIALLEWGPASLFYIEPRERIKVRTEWLDGGLMMPPFFSIMEEAKINPADICVRYALSAYLDLNKAINNLRRCYGFPYQEYIGYLNTLTRGQRVRREHLHLIDRLRRWAIVRNIDAIFWIDYTKANLPAGSFKIGPRSSRPFHPNHLEICGGLLSLEDQKRRADVEEASDVALSDVNDDRALVDPGSYMSPQGISGPTVFLADSLGLRLDRSAANGAPSKLKPFVFQDRQLLQLRQLPPQTSEPMEKQPTQQPPQNSAKSVSSEGGSDKDDASRLARRAPNSARKPSEGDKMTAELRGMIQEESIPPVGSIYTRTITPGPGYYGMPEMKISEARFEKETFTTRRRDFFDEVAISARKRPGPGVYQPKPGLTDTAKRLGIFGKEERLPSPEEAVRKLPFISEWASRVECHGIHSPAIFYATQEQETTVKAYSPEYSVGRSRRLE